MKYKYPSRSVFVRHAESVGNVESHDGAAELAVPNHAFESTHHGRQQSQITGNFLMEKYPDGFDVGFVSTFIRSQETYAGFGGDSHFPRPIIDSRLNEKYDGIFHGLTNAEIDRHLPLGQMLRAKEGWYHFSPPGGRNGPDVELAIYSFLDMLNRDYAGKRCLRVCHGNWLFLLDRIMENMSARDIEQQRKTTTIPNCCVTAYESGPHGLKRTLYRFVPWEGKLEKTKGEHFA
jgi:broad specificity phosphatase PhoE